jgi:hypothetical protein
VIWQLPVALLRVTTQFPEAPSLTVTVPVGVPLSAETLTEMVMACPTTGLAGLVPVMVVVVLLVAEAI